MLLLISLLTLIILTVKVLPILHSAHWTIRGFDFPRLQLAILAAFLLLAQIVYLDFTMLTSWLLCSIVFLCCCYHLWWILPYTKLWPAEVLAAKDNAVERQLSIITANVLMPNRDAHKLIELVHLHQPDVLVTLESNQWWQDQLDALKADMPYTINCPLDRQVGSLPDEP